VKRSNRLLILLGLLIAIGGGALAVAIAGSGGGGGGGGAGPGAIATPTPGPQVQVVVASTGISAGTIIDKTMVKTTSRSMSDLTGLGGNTFSSVNDVIGRVAGTNIVKDQILVTGADLLTPGSAIDGKSLSGAIDKGFVGMSMELDQTNGVGTLIVPGDRVDIILTTYITQLTISVRDSLGTSISAGGQGLTSKLVLQNCKIISTLLPPTTTSAAAPATAAPGSSAVAAYPSSATVQFNDRHMIAIIEVTPEQAELIRWAQRTEAASPQTYIDMAFVLRSSQDDATDPMSSNPFTQIPGITLSEIISKYGLIAPDPLSSLPNPLGNKIQW
jgi:Flp pilus assembly protein CpaB